MKKSLLLFLVLIIAVATHADDNPYANLSRDELYRLFFNEDAPPRLQNFMVRFYADSMYLGDMEIFYESDFANFEFHSPKYSSYLDTLLTTDARSRIDSKDGSFNSYYLDLLGFTINLNELTQELHVITPPGIKAMQRMSLLGRASPRGTIIEPAIFSLYLNLQATDDFNCQPDCDRMPATLDLDGAIAILGFALEGSGNIREPRKGQPFSKNHIRRGDVRLVRDIYSIDSRISLGDVGANTDGLMRYETMGGLRYEYDKRLFRISNYDILDEYYKMRFFLPHASQVEIQVNNRTVRRLNLLPGHHEISGFGGIEGANLVRILITKEDGSIEAIPYEFTLGGSRNLVKGESRLSATAGVRRSFAPMGYKYDTREPGFSADYLYGLFSILSMGISGQASKQNLMAGSQALLSINKNNWLELRGLANYEDSAIGKRSELRYTYSSAYLSLSLTGYYQNSLYNPDLFRSFSGIAANYAGGTASASTRLFTGSISANFGMYFNRENEYSPNIAKRYGASLTQNIFKISLTANASVNQEKTGWQPYYSFNAGYTFGLDRHNFSLMNTTTMRSAPPDYEEEEWDNRSNLSWNWSNGGSGAGARSYFAGAGMQKAAESFNARVGARHYYNRASLSANYNMYSYEYYEDIKYSHSARAEFGTSFMFADGLWAIGRPVNRGFILADTRKSLSGSTVHINYSDYHDTYFSKSGWLGAAYYNQISNYRSNEITISLTDLPMGAWLEQNRYYAMGAYKQGYALRLGGEGSALLLVNLLKEDGTPLSYTYVNVGSRPTFTGNDGALLMGNIRPGQKYRISFGENSGIEDIEIDIPANAGNFIELPDITISRGKP
jgi:outer membrane usher protein FimD/PapC